MGIYEYNGILPEIGSSCYIAPSADIIGHVELGEGSSVWFGTVLRGDIAPIRIGRGCNIQDNSVLHGIVNGPVILGDHVAVGHGCIIHAATIEENCLIGMGAVVLDQAHIGRGSIIGAGAVVPPHATIPPFSQVLGVPGKVVKTLAVETEQARIEHAARYQALAQAYLEKK